MIYLKEYKNVLVPVDGSVLSDLAFKQALILVKLIGGEITVIHVTKDPDIHFVGIEGKDMVTKDESEKRKSQKIAKNILKKYTKNETDDGMIVNSILERGDAASEIIKASNDFDLIIMGTHGKGILSSIFLGSVAEKVSHRCCCPILLIREKS